MLIQDLSETSKTKLIKAGFQLDDPMNDNQTSLGHGDVFGFFQEAPIHYAAREGDLDLLQELFDKGADINIQSDTYKWTPIIWAGNYGRKDAVRFLIEKGADLTYKYRFMDREEEPEENLKSLISQQNTWWPTTFFWTQYQKRYLGKQVDYSGVSSLVDEKLSEQSNDFEFIRK